MTRNKNKVRRKKKTPKQTKSPTRTNHLVEIETQAVRYWSERFQK